MRKTAFWTALAVTAAALAGLIAMPAAALAGAKRGLAVCAEVIVPIICEGDAIGSVALFSRDQRTKMGDTELKLAQTAAGFLGRQMEN